MSPNDIKTVQDVVNWLRYHCEWTDSASADCAFVAQAVLEGAIKRLDAANKKNERWK